MIEILVGLNRYIFKIFVSILYVWILVLLCYCCEMYKLSGILDIKFK